MMSRPKILCIQFKHLGDCVVLTPVLRAVKNYFREGELHVLIPKESVPLLENVNWIDKVWSMPRKRGVASILETCPIIRGLRREQFDISIDFVGNDRGAIVSRAIGSPRRIGPIAPKGFFLRPHLYTEAMEAMDTNRHETIRAWAVASILGIPFPEDVTAEISANPNLTAPAKEVLNGTEVICYVSTTQPKREWPLSNWMDFYKMTRHLKIKMAFTAGKGEQEKRLLQQMAKICPDLPILEPIEPLEVFLAVLSQLKGFISMDTGPLHFAAGLGVPTIGIFGPT
ncbi:MAG: glycosyltransferase family 9 protein, partial [Deltaproteobacteria bacterium]|nr:glycosyltransferase family 9 protein [Deltaproteobacteria bacterium]